MNPNNAIQTKHQLDFESAPWVHDDSIRLFRVGTCDGQWSSTPDSFCIISVLNGEPGNGHLDDVFEWFEFSCKQHNKNLLVLECFNKDFYNHLITKRGFVALDKEKQNVIKVFNHRAYKHLLKHGNDVIKKGTLKCI